MNKSINTGCVIYTETEGGIKADWISQKQDKIQRGTGSGKRITKRIDEKVYEGEYEITYIDSNGNSFPKLRLTIIFMDDYYHLTWKRNDIITDLGIGIVSDDKLIASYNEY